MARSNSWLWFALALVLLLPTAAGRVLLDIAGGLMLASLLIPILLAGLGWFGWRILQSRMVTCSACGMRTFSNSGNCPICGTVISENINSSHPNTFQGNETTPASSATIDIEVKDASNGN